MKKAISFFGISLIFLLLLSQGSTVSGDVSGETESDITTVQTEALVVEIKGGFNVPFYFFWSANTPDVKYKIQMDSIFEANDTNEDGVYDLGSDKKVGGSGISLASLNWEFTPLEKTESNGVITSIDFNITTNTGGMNPTSRDTTITFVNHISSTAESQLKFDVVIDNYVFNDDKAMLVFAFKILSENDVDAEPSQDGQLVSFGDGFFYSEDVASDDDGDLSVGLSQASEEGEGKLYLAYEHFNGKLVHDPTIGIGSGVDNSVTSDTSYPSSGDEETDQESSDEKQSDNLRILPDLSRDSLFAPTLFATAVFLGIPIVVYHFKRKS